MASPAASWNGRLQRRLAVLRSSSTLQVGCEAAAAAILGTEAAALLWWHASLAGPVQILLWAQIVATVACLRWAGLFPLFGPVLVYDLIRTARRNRYFYMRVLYALLLSFMLLWGYLLEYLDARGAGLSNNDMASFASGFFYAYMIVQFGLITLLTPAYTAGAIAEEKDRKTLPFLLATDLRDREIVLGKLVSRLLNLTLFVLTGLPILSFLQFIGGIDPGLLLAGFAATGLTMLGLACLSMFNSVVTKRARDAIVVTYVEAFAYVVLSGASWLLLLIHGAATFPNFGNWVSPVTVQDLVEWFNAGNLVAIMIQISAALERGGRIDLIVPPLLRDYAIFMSLLSLIALGWAVLRMRPRALKEAGEGARQRRGLFPAWPRPHLGGWQPMIWKEIFVERGLRLHWIARIVIALMVMASFFPVGLIVWGYLDGGEPWRRFVEEMNVWARIVGAGIFSLMMLSVAVRAAGSISGERDKQTLSELLATPLSSDAILFSKWLGSLLSVRWAWGWLVLVWMAAGVVGGLHPAAVPVMVVAWFVYASFLASLGLWFSMRCRTTLRAIVWTLFTGLLLYVGHWLIWLMCMPLFWGGTQLGRMEFLEYVAKFEVGLTPPFALGGCFPIELFEDDNGLGRREWIEWFLYGLGGVLFWAVASAALWGIISVRFRQVTNRSRLFRRRIVRATPQPRRRSAKGGNGSEGIMDVIRAEEPP